MGLCLGLGLASMFPKKHMPEQIIQRGMPTGPGRGESWCSKSQTPGCPLPLPLSPCSPDQSGSEGSISQARPAREAGRRGRPKNSGPAQCVPSSRHPRVDFVSELGLDLGMGSVLHHSSKHSTSSASVRQPVSLAVCVRCPAAQAQALGLLPCGACHGHRFYMILLNVVSCASLPSRPWCSPPVRCCAVVSHRLRIRSTTILHTYRTACSTTAPAAV